MNADEAYHQEQEHQQWLEHVAASRELKEIIEEIRNDRLNEDVTKAA